METYRSYAFRGLNILCLFLLIFTFVKLRESIQIEQKNKEEREQVVFVSSVVLPSTPRIIKIAKASVEKPKSQKNIINTVDTSSKAVLATYTGNISYYAADCRGCTGTTASGYDVRENIYYNDPTYGTLRVVAGDSSIAFGTVLRINSNQTTTLAIVLDRGGAIGFNRKYLFDLLCESEAQAYKLGVLYSAKIEVLRYGY